MASGLVAGQGGIVFACLPNTAGGWQAYVSRMALSLFAPLPLSLSASSMQCMWGDSEGPMVGSRQGT